MLPIHKLDNAIFIGQQSHLKISDCKLIASGKINVQLDPASEYKMLASYHFLKDFVDKRIPIYGINTQFGDQVSLIDPNLHSDNATYYKSIEDRQKNLIFSHCCSLGEPTKKEIVRVAMSLRAHCLSQGYSGVKPNTVHAILSMLNAGIIPVVNRYGSIGASGDLIPLASIASAIIGGNTNVEYQNKIMPAITAISAAGLKPFVPEIRDGLAMINGTSFMTAIASLALYDLNILFKSMLTTIALSLESMQIIQSAYHPLVHMLKGQKGEIEVNNHLLKCWKGSNLLTDLDELRIKNSHDTLRDARAVQDVYSLRAVAQGFGPFAENIKRAIDWVEIEVNSVNDNPIMDIENKKIHHSANFMGYYVTDACDIMKMDIAQASSWLHAILANMVHPRKNHGLPTSLVENTEKFNGFRPLQLLAASIAVQNRKLAQSHQAYMLPTEGDNQDVNSLGTHAAFDLQESVCNLEKLTGILLLASIQALEYRGLHKASPTANLLQKKVRRICHPIHECQPLTETLNKITTFIREGQMLDHG